MDRSNLGQLGEEIAVNYLTQKGFKIRERNYRCLLGEIDIIAEDQETLVFIEVRSRRGTHFGLPQETVNWAKQQRIRKIANHYLKVKGVWRMNWRFDVIGILFDEKSEIKSIELICDAF